LGWDESEEYVINLLGRPVKRIVAPSKVMRLYRVCADH